MQKRHSTSSHPALLLGLMALMALGGLSACGGAGDGQAQAKSGQGQRGNARGPGKKEQPAIVVALDEVRRQPLSQLYSTSSTLRADRRVTVTSRTRGVVKRLQVEEGDAVRAGQVLAYLEDEEQQIQHDRAKTTEEALQRDYARNKRLHEQKLVNDEQFETIRRQAEDATHATALAKLLLDRTVIRAPFGGVIVSRQVDVGSTVSDGTAMYELADLDPLYADINVPERHVLKFQKGQQVRMQTDIAQVEFEASIERIAPAVDAETGTVKVTVSVPGQELLRPGTFVRVNIVVDTHQEALVVPRTALVAEGRRWNLFRAREEAEKGFVAEQLEVEIGFEEGKLVEILQVVGDKTLEVGDRVVSAGAPALSDDAPIRVLEEDGGA